MTKYEEKVLLEAAKHIVENNATIRGTALKFYMKKTTLDKKIREELPQLDKDLYDRVMEVLSLNWQSKHYKGGVATHRKFFHSESAELVYRETFFSVGNEIYFKFEWDRMTSKRLSLLWQVHERHKPYMSTADVARMEGILKKGVLLIKNEKLNV